MNVTGKTKIWRRDFDGKPRYSRAISAQEYKDGRKGDWIREYEPVQFPKGTDITNGSIIDVKRGFETVYRGRDGIKRKLVVQEFVVVDAGHDLPEGFQNVSADEFVPF